MQDLARLIVIIRVKHIVNDIQQPTMGFGILSNSGILHTCGATHGSHASFHAFAVPDASAADARYSTAVAACLISDAANILDWTAVSCATQPQRLQQALAATGKAQLPAGLTPGAEHVSDRIEAKKWCCCVDTIRQMFD